MTVRHFGGGKAVAMVLHGFTQRGESMEEFAQFFGPPVLAPDLPGHGEEPQLPATMDAAVRQVAELYRASTCRVLVGYSMGGRVALRVALELGDEVELLVLVSTSAGIHDPFDRAERLSADQALAADLRAEGLGAFLERWSDLPIFPQLKARSEKWRDQDRLVRLGGSAEALAQSLEGMGQGVTMPVTDEQLRGLETVTMLAAGAMDALYVAEAKRMAELMPKGFVVIHPTGGHALLGEDPGWVGRRVRIRV
jgi:2-succinyl-6-hydroxy-2,4-cyclohexadiene-1-carboxylate synthase